MKGQVCALQEEGGANWSYSQGEIEDLLQNKQPLPPQLQQLMDARSALLNLLTPASPSTGAKVARPHQEPCSMPTACFCHCTAPRCKC